MRQEWNSSNSPAKCLRCGLNDTFLRRDDPCPADEKPTQFTRLERVGLARCGHCGEKGQCTKAHAHQGDHTFALGMEEECDDCFKGLSRHVRGEHPFNWQGRLTTGHAPMPFPPAHYALMDEIRRDQNFIPPRSCGCGPNQACSRCSRPGPRGSLRCPCGAEGLHDRTPRCPPACKHGLSFGCGLCATTRPVAVFFGQQYADPGTPPTTTAEAAVESRCPHDLERGCVTCERIDGERLGCAHQWLLLDGKAWCPNCDEVRAPGERKR